MTLSNQEFFQIVLDELKNPNNLPLRIPRTRCPQNKKNCTKSHKDIVIVERNQSGQFLLRDCGMHDDEFVEAWFSEKEILKFLLNESKRYTLRNNVVLKERNFFRDQALTIHYSRNEIESLRQEAKQKKCKIVDLIRDKSLTKSS